MSTNTGTKDPRAPITARQWLDLMESEPHKAAMEKMIGRFMDSGFPPRGANWLANVLAEFTEGLSVAWLDYDKAQVNALLKALNPDLPGRLEAVRAELAETGDAVQTQRDQHDKDRAVVEKLAAKLRVEHPDAEVRVHQVAPGVYAVDVIREEPGAVPGHPTLN